MAEQPMKDQTAIVGIGTTPFTRSSERTVLDLATDAGLGAIDDAGLSPSDIDGLVTFYWHDDTEPPRELIRSLGLERCNFQLYCGLGGPWACSAVATAAMAVYSGLCRSVLVYRAFNGRSGGARRERTARGPDQWLSPFGVAHAATRLGQLVTAHMDRYGTTNLDFAHLAVAQRNNAVVNEKAMMRAPLTVEEHQASPWVIYPFRLLDCCLRSDAGLAVVVTSSERARDLRHAPVYISAAMGGTLTTDTGTLFAQRWQTNGVHAAAPLYEGAGISPGDVDFAELYDPFTGVCLLHAEDFGLVEPGGSGDAARTGRFALDGAMPINTHGGLLSEAYTHGMGHIVEAVQQLRPGGVVDDLCGPGGHEYDRTRCRQLRAPEIGLVCGEAGDSALVLRAS
jgi:acetyl-CoA acetyltransferase